MPNRARRFSRENIDTSRACIKWSPEEEAKLLQSVIDQIPFEEIALEHKRSIIAVKARLYNYKVSFNRNLLAILRDTAYTTDIQGNT